MRDRTAWATNREDEGVGAQLSGSAGIELPLDIFGQARHAVRVLPWTWEAQTKLQLGGRICSKHSRNGRVCDLERLETDVTHWVGVGFGIFWSGQPVRLTQGKTKRNVPGRGSSAALDLPLFSDNISSFLDRAGEGENILKTFVLEDEAVCGTFPLPLSFISRAWEDTSVSCPQYQQQT